MENNYIRVECQTQLDDVNCSVVNQMVAMPLIGHKIRVIYRQIICEMSIHQITHCQDNLGPYLELVK
jgi:hypothetical protein